jgi:hypothetical protein
MKRFLVATAVLALSAPAVFAATIDSAPQFSSNHLALEIMKQQSAAVRSDHAYKILGPQVTENARFLQDRTEAQRIENQQSAAVARDVPASMLNASSVTTTAPDLQSNDLALKIMEQQSKAIAG